MDSAMDTAEESIDSLEQVEPPQEITRQTKEPARYPCTEPLCPKRFTRRGALKEHTRRSHAKDYPFTCRRLDSCSKAFATLRDRARHELVHDEDKQFVCSGCVDVVGLNVLWGCDKKFTREDGLVAHLKASGGTCYEQVSWELSHNIYHILWDYKTRVSPTTIGKWTCQYGNPWNLVSGKSSWNGCGEQFGTYVDLESHLKNDNGGSCGAQLKSAAAIHAAERAENLVQQELRRQRKSGVVIRKKLSAIEEIVPATKVTVISYRMIYGFHGRPVEILLRVPKEDKAWTVSNLYLGNVSIWQYSLERLEEYGSTIAHAYRLRFTIFYAIPDGISITAEVNLSGDLNCHTHGTVVFKPVPESPVYTEVDCVYETFNFVDVS
ncbi:hypothetical protein BKA61DRAFT_261029 [Leptodontidium sp. MPI-SDFR-AT-0119]|nr:hypothetical protein BKA61DRAFT_261029 [Leptodontidium sp. MPI-SDFR-AT-0119]